MKEQFDEVTRRSVKAVADTASRKLVAVWAQLGKDRADYRKYKIKSGIKITPGAGGGWRAQSAVDLINDIASTINDVSEAVG